MWYSTKNDVVNGLKYIFETIHNKFPNTNIYYFGITRRGDNTLVSITNAVNSAISDLSNDTDYLTYVNTPDKITADMLKSDNLHPKLETYSVFVEELLKAGCVIMDKNGKPISIPQ